MKHDFKRIEPKWQMKWEEDQMLPCGRLQHEAQVLRTDRIPLSQRRRYARRSYQGLLQPGGYLQKETDGGL